MNYAGNDDAILAHNLLSVGTNRGQMSGFALLECIVAFGPSVDAIAYNHDTRTDRWTEGKEIYVPVPKGIRKNSISPDRRRYPLKR
jgi:hypothetical protein